MNLTGPETTYRVYDEYNVLRDMTRAQLISRLANYEASYLVELARGGDADSLIAIVRGDTGPRNLLAMVNGDTGSRWPEVKTDLKTKPMDWLMTRWAEVKVNFRRMREEGDLIRVPVDAPLADGDMRETRFLAHLGISVTIEGHEDGVEITLPRQELAQRIIAYELSAMKGDIKPVANHLMAEWAIKRVLDAEDILAARWAEVRDHYYDRAERGMLYSLPNENGHDPECTFIRNMESHRLYEIEGIDGDPIKIGRAPLIARLLAIQLDDDERDNLLESDRIANLTAREHDILNGSTGLTHASQAELKRLWAAGRERYYEIAADDTFDFHVDDPEGERLVELQAGPAPAHP